MARKTKRYVVPVDGGRDAGKCFLITEMSAFDAEDWASRALLAIAQSGAPISEDAMRAGWGAILMIGFRGLLVSPYDTAVKPLLKEMIDNCVRFVPDMSRGDVVRTVDKEDVEEVQTIINLRSEVVEIHTGFSVTAFLSNLGKAEKEKMLNTPTTPTSPA